MRYRGVWIILGRFVGEKLRNLKSEMENLPLAVYFGKAFLSDAGNPLNYRGLS